MARSIRLRLFGGLEVEGLEGERFGSRKARSALKRLAVARGAAVHADVLADALWADELPSRPADQVAVLISRIRAVLGPDAVARTDAGYALRYEWLDLDAVGELAEEADRRVSSGDFAAARKLATAGLDLVRGPLLADEPDAAWAETERRAVERIITKLRLAGAQASFALGDFADAGDLAADALDHDPYDEAALRLFMNATARAGRPGAALNAYAAMQQRLREELGVDVSAETIAVHSLLLSGAPRGGDDVPRDAALEPTTLPGRANELATLDAARDDAAAGRARFVVVEGEAGIGKTRLLDIWSRRARASNAIVLSARSEEAGRALPLDVVFDALHQYLRGLDSDERVEMLGPHASILGPLLGLTDTEGDVASAVGYGDPSVGQMRLFIALVSVFERLAERAVTALLLDDIHLASTSTTEWLNFLMHRASDARLLVIVARRPEEGGPIASATTIELGPLDLVATEAIVGSERAVELLERSAGNPLFLVELAAAEPSDEPPVSIRTSVVDRCDRAGDAAPTIRAAAVLGIETDVDLLASVLRLPAINVLEHLEEGVRRHFLEDRGATFVFRHDLVRDALDTSTGAARRAFLHREAAGALATRADADPLQIAYHARLGGHVERASVALVQAARLAAARHDPVEADRLASDAIALHDSPQARIERARIRIAQTRPAEAAEDATVALGQGAGAPALDVAGWAAYYLRDFDKARRLAEDGARLADDPAVRTSCLALAGRIRHALGDLEGAEGPLVEAASSARGVDLGLASAWLGALRVHQSRNDEALDLLALATSTPASTHGFALLHGHMNTAYAYAQLGRPMDALAALDRLDEETKRLGADRFIPRSDNFRGWILRNLGATHEADDCNARAHDVALALRQPEPLVWAVLDLTDGLLRRGALSEAGKRLDEISELHARYADAHDDVRDSIFWFRHDLKSRYHRGRFALACGDTDLAQATAVEVAEDAEALGVRRHVVMARLLEAQARAATGQRADLDAVATLLDDIDAIGGLEAWWFTADAAATFGVDAWWERAAARVSRVATVAGTLAETFKDHAGAKLDELRDAHTARR